MDILNISTYPYHDPDARWSCRMADGKLLLIVGSDQDRICLALTWEEAQDVMGRWTALVAQGQEEKPC